MPRRLRLHRPILTLLFASLTFACTLIIGIMSERGVQINLLGWIGKGPVAALVGPELPLPTRIEPGTRTAFDLRDPILVAKTGEWSYCDYTSPEFATYGTALQQVNVPETISPGSVFAVDMVFKNTGNTRLFSADSGCNGRILNVGTQKTQDRKSALGRGDLTISGWLSPNRIQMTDSYVEPEGTFHVIFQSIAPEGDDIYREFFQTVVEGVAWTGEAFFVDIPIGTPTEKMKSDIVYVKDLSLAASTLTEERNIEVVLSDQMVYRRFGEMRVSGIQMSSGAADTPTPRGTYKILSKQELRIGGQAPHYRMPYFQMWDARGYGFHALPYLASDGGKFWSEALTHIGIPVSHGCIRTLPEDAVELYGFTDIGTPVWVH